MRWTWIAFSNWIIINEFGCKCIICILHTCGSAIWAACHIFFLCIELTCIVFASSLQTYNISVLEHIRTVWPTYNLYVILTLCNKSSLGITYRTTFVLQREAYFQQSFRWQISHHQTGDCWCSHTHDRLCENTSNVEYLTTTIEINLCVTNTIRTDSHGGSFIHVD